MNDEASDNGAIGIAASQTGAASANGVCMWELGILPYYYYYYFIYIQNCASLFL